MSIPRIRKGICCFTLEQWALRMATSQVTTFFLVAILFFILSAVATNTEETASQTILIVIGVIFLIPAAFAVVLVIGLNQKKTKLLVVWLIYSIIGNACFIILILGGGIFYIATIEVGNGFLFLVLGLIVSGNLVYSTLVVYSLYLDYTEEKTSNTAELGEVQL